MISIDVHNVVSVVKDTRIFDTFTVHKYTFTDNEGNESIVKAFVWNNTQLAVSEIAHSRVEKVDAQTV